MTKNYYRLKGLLRWRNPLTKAKRQASNKKSYLLRKLACFRHYGGNTPRCSCECGCRTSNMLWLTLDHINGGGSAKRRTRGGDQYFYLVKNKFPDELRVLCFNCNCGCARAAAAEMLKSKLDGALPR